MVQAPGNRPLLGDDLGDKLPFTPAASVEAPQTWSLRAEQALTLVQRWRSPLTLLLGILIAAAAFFAYASQSDDSSGDEAESASGVNPGVNPVGGDGSDGSDGGALVGAVEGMESDADGPDPSLTTTTERGSLTSSTGPPGPPEASGTRPGTSAASTTPSSTPTTAASTASTVSPTSTTSAPTTTTTASTTVTTAPPVEPPPECKVRDGRRRAGVQVESNDSEFAPSYDFYDDDGEFLLSTSSLGEPDDYIDGRQPDALWRSRNRFDEDDVYFVAATDADGNTSELVRCDRD